MGTHSNIRFQKPSPRRDIFTMLNCSIRQRSWCKTSENMCHFAILLRSQTLQALNQIRSSRHLPSAAMPRCAFLCLGALVYVRFTQEADEPTATLLTHQRH